MDELLARMIKRQVFATLVVAVLAFVFLNKFGVGLHGAFSALAGGGSAILGGLAAKMKLRNKTAGLGAGSVLVNILIAEAIKIAVIAITLLLVFKFYEKLVPIALIAGLAAAAIMSGAAIFAINEKNNA
ncbi:ATP synthase subunit I [Methylobacillus flagellatus]|uniref:ATP synthase subunit I n=1 Tax=Methylobacillus flagellatus TaxID=405 RepID=UPI002853CD14|nr:ATP synthase subunit I [Methylobacillus flagellatus]MDR5172110.1 ATP synthase subunit I [Methylobacillus flagellatus]